MSGPEIPARALFAFLLLVLSWNLGGCDTERCFAPERPVDPDSETDPEDDPEDDPLPAGDYPTTYPDLSDAEHRERLAEFRATVPYACSGLDRFGFTVASGGCSPQGPVHPDRLPVYVARAKEELVRGSRFTGVEDAASLVVKQAWIFAGVRAQIWFEEQRALGELVPGTDIHVHVDRLGVREIRGHRFPEFELPETPGISAEAAEESVIGAEIPWFDLAGDERIHPVEPGDVLPETVRVIFPFETADALELRVAWRVRIGGSIPSWHLYVDEMTGTLLEVEPLFVTWR